MPIHSACSGPISWSTLAARVSLLAGLLVAGIACQTPEPKVQSHLSGRITVRPSVDTTQEYSGFRVLVTRAQGRTIDTLGHASTDPDGRFATTVTAPERGQYLLTIWGRRGQERLATTNYVVAAGDSSTVTAELPLNRPLQVRSPENSALLGYQNTMAMYRRMLTQRLQAEAYGPNAMVQSVRQTSSVLWELQNTFPGTYAGQLAAVESLSLLAGWNDSLVVTRARQIEPSNPRYVEAARIARRAAARLEGQAGALELLDDFEARAASEQQRAGVKATRIQTFIDSLQSEAALSAGQQLRNEHPDTRWAEWADRAIYEVENLLPGMTAPSFQVRTTSGESLSLNTLRGRPIVLEFYRPGDDLFTRQLATRNSLYEATRPDSVVFLAISVEPDTVVNRAFLDNQSPPGHHVIAPEGQDDPLARRYNVVEVPSRFLIDAEGRIEGRYPGSAFFALQEDLTQLVSEDTLKPSQ